MMTLILGVQSGADATIRPVSQNDSTGLKSKDIIMQTHFLRTAIVASALIGGGAFAAPAAPPGAGDPLASRPAASAATPGSMAAMPAKGHAKADQDMTGRVEKRITALHAKLQITPSQEPQWDKFTQVMRDNARGMDQTFQNRVRTMPGMTAVENMRSYAQVAAEHAEQTQRLVPAFQALYDTMSDAQKRGSDQVFRDDAHQGRHGKQG